MSDIMNVSAPASLETRLREHVRRLASRPRPPWVPEHREARQYIRTHLEASGLAVREEPHREANLTATNLVAEPWPPGDTRPLLVVGAHYDSIPNSAGADDNASAVAALLELAHWLPRAVPPERCRAQVQLVAFDLEEYGMLGSRMHARGLRAANRELRGMISLEMLGYADHRPNSQQLPPHLERLYPSVANFIGVCGNFKSETLVQTTVQGMKTVDGLPVEFITVPGRGEVLPEVRLSDHSSFWDLEFPALMITDTSFFRNPHYHRPGDTPETLDYTFLTKVTLGVCAAVEQLVLAEKV